MKPLKAPKHLDLIRQLPCCLCGAPSEAHHLLRVPEKCMGRKAGDNWAVPLCHAHHDARHREGASAKVWDHWERTAGVELARRLWEATGDIEAMEQVVRMG